MHMSQYSKDCAENVKSGKVTMLVNRLIVE